MLTMSICYGSCLGTLINLFSCYMQLVYNTHSNIGMNIKKKMILCFYQLNPSDMTCINSSLNFLAKLARNNTQPSIVTFDQPLYWKSSKMDSIIDDTVVMLGTFHTVMNLLGCISGMLWQNQG